MFPCIHSVCLYILSTDCHPSNICNDRCRYRSLSAAAHNLRACSILRICHNKSACRQLPYRIIIPFPAYKPTHTKGNDIPCKIMCIFPALYVETGGAVNLYTQTSQIPKMASSLAPYCLHHLSCHQNTLQPATGTRAKAFLMYPGMCSMNSLINASTCSSVIWKTVLMH